jgi:hypothetical protein
VRHHWWRAAKACACGPSFSALRWGWRWRVEAVRAVWSVWRPGVPAWLHGELGADRHAARRWIIQGWPRPFSRHVAQPAGATPAWGRSRPSSGGSYASGPLVGAPVLGSSRPPEGAARHATTGRGAAFTAHGRSERGLRGQSPPLVPRPCWAEQVVPCWPESAATRPPQEMVGCCAHQ